MSEVRVAGRGLAALTCALLLARQGRAVRISGTEPTGARWLVMPQVAVGLLCEVWGDDAGVLDGAWQVQRRSVRWGTAGRRQVPAGSVTLDGTALNRRLAAHLSRTHRDRVSLDDRMPPPAPTGTPQAGWFVSTVPDSDPRRFVQAGRRHIIAAQAQLAPRADPHTCSLETGSRAWAFLAPINRDRLLVQAMVPGPVHDPVPILGDILDETGQGDWLAEPPAAAAVVPAAPRLLAAPCGPGWLTVGAAAVQFDPLSGSGAAQAVRTAILAAAAIDAVDRGHPAQAVLQHYAARIRAAFTDHLRGCLGYYRAAFPAEAWHDEIDAATAVLTRSGLSRSGPAVMTSTPSRMDFVLAGLRLERRARRPPPTACRTQ